MFSGDTGKILLNFSSPSPRQSALRRGPAPASVPTDQVSSSKAKSSSGASNEVKSSYSRCHCEPAAALGDEQNLAWHAPGRAETSCWWRKGGRGGDRPATAAARVLTKVGNGPPKPALVDSGSPITLVPPSVLPAGSTLRWQSIEGSLSGPLERVQSLTGFSSRRNRATLRIWSSNSRF